MSCPLQVKLNPLSVTVDAYGLDDGYESEYPPESGDWPSHVL